MEPTTSVEFVKGVGPAVASLLKKLQIRTVQDLVNYVPFRYDDFSKVIRINQVRPGPVTIKVTFSSVSSRYARRGLHITEAMAHDESGSVKVVWFNQPYRAKSLQSSKEYYLSGEFAKNYRYFAITNPACEAAKDFPINTARLVPVYRLTKGLSLSQLRKYIKHALDSYKPAETLPRWLIEEESLLSKVDALQEMHFPQNNERLEAAKKRLGFEELFELLLASELNRQAHARQLGIRVSFKEALIKQTVEKLPFSLTDDQRKVAWQLFQAMDSGEPMNCLLQGDVGSGKTVVAALLALNTMAEGFQVGFMAPTELLANQHAQSLHELLEKVGYHEKIVLVTGSMTKSQKEIALQSISSGEAQLIIGTHALFQESVTFHSLGLVIVDEQHRFGVEQRKALQAKAKSMPHVLHMSATPIPRSLALTLYGDMTIAVIEQMPAGRKTVHTEVAIAENREKIYAKVIAEIDLKRQAFVVCPQIEESDTGRLSVKKIYEQLTKTWLKNYKVGLLHGKMSAEEKDSIMQQFASGTLDVLVATTVIEVGVNVPNASVMVIEGADMFGLAQLHQLRGRVGRGSDEAYCYLVLSSNEEPSRRLRYIEHEHSGFKLADYDLELRGPGAIYGKMQHGALDLRVAKLSDSELIKRARYQARNFVQKEEKLVHYPYLQERIARLRTITNLN